MYQVGVYALIDPEYYDDVVEDVVSLPEVSILHSDIKTGKTLLMVSIGNTERFEDIIHYIRNINAVLASDILFSFNDTESDTQLDKLQCDKETSLSEHWRPAIFVED